MFIYFGELQASGTLPLDVAFVVIGIVHDRVPRNNQRGNLAPDELVGFVWSSVAVACRALL